MSDNAQKQPISDRLSTSYETCKKAFDTWDQAKDDISKKDQLEEATHELRRVLAAIEIEIARSDSKQWKNKAPHQDSKNTPSKKKNTSSSRKTDTVSSESESVDGNDLPDFLTDSNNGTSKPSDKRSQRKKQTKK